MDTNLTVKQIENALVFSGWYSVRNDIIIPNLSWGLLNHEADLAILNKTGYLTEIEIKRSLSDLRADFKKDVYHCDEHVYRFQYCLPLSIREKALELFAEHWKQIGKLYNIGTDYPNSQKIITDRYPYVIWYDENARFKIESRKSDVRSGARKLFLEERLIVARLASCRYWDMRRKQIVGEQQELTF